MLPDNYAVPEGVWIFCELCQAPIVKDEHRFSAAVAAVLDHQKAMHS